MIAPNKAKPIFVSLASSIFLCSVLYFVVFSSGVSDDDAFTYAAVFAVVIIILNAVILTAGYLMFRKIRCISKCASCGRSIAAGDKMCPKCGAMQPLSLDSSVYLEPQKQEKTIRPK